MSLYFKYHTRDVNGDPKDGTIKALDEDDALIKLKEQGVIVISIEVVKPGRIEIIKKGFLGVIERINQRRITKICPYCAEEIRGGAILCRFCGKDLKVQAPDEKWYFKTASLIAAFLCVGPLVLPLVWLNPRLSQKTKVVITAIVIILSWFLGFLFISSLKSLKQYYGLILQNNS